MAISRALTYADLLALGITYCRAHLNKLEREGKFPAHFMFSPRHTCWDELDSHAWLQEKRDGARGHPSVPRDPVTGHYLRRASDNPPVIVRRGRATPVAAVPVRRAWPVAAPPIARRVLSGSGE